MKAPVLFVFIFLGCICGSQIDNVQRDIKQDIKQDSEDVSLLETQANITNLFASHLLNKNSTQHWESIKQMFLAKNSAFLSVLAKANPTTVHQILQLLYTLVNKNKNMVKKFDFDVVLAKRKVVQTKKAHDTLVQLLINKEEKLTSIKQKITYMKARIAGSKGRADNLRAQIAIAKREYRIAALKHRDANIALRRNKPTYSKEIYLIKQIIRLVKRLLPCKDDRWLFYKNNCYTSINKPMTWSNANYFCKRLMKGGRLAEVHGSEANKLFNGRIGHGFHWSGGKKYGSIWKWTSGMRITNFFWGSRQVHGKCLAMRNGKSALRWRAMPCHRSYKFGCMYTPHKK